MDKKNILNELLDILTAHFKLNFHYGENYEQDRQLFRGICNQSLELNGIDKRFYELQDTLLKLEREEKGVVYVRSLKFEDNICLWQGDITRLDADAIVNAANDQYLGCFMPCHNCIDNIIMSASGFQMRNELMKLKESKDYELQKVKVTKGYNLPCMFVFHTAGPQILSQVRVQDRVDLKNCYLNCLETAKRMKLSSIAFCCISTGVFSFPNDLACEIAVSTVKNWLKENDFCLNVIFNVFKDIDKELYERKLRG